MEYRSVRNKFCQGYHNTQELVERGISRRRGCYRVHLRGALLTSVRISVVLRLLECFHVLLNGL